MHITCVLCKSVGKRDPQPFVKSRVCRSVCENVFMKCADIASYMSYLVCMSLHIIIYAQVFLFFVFKAMLVRSVTSEEQKRVGA